MPTLVTAETPLIRMAMTLETALFLPPGFSFLKIFIYFFAYLWFCWVSIAAWTFSRCGSRAQGLRSSCGAGASHCGGFSCGARALQGAWASVVVAPRLSCSVAQGVLVSRPGIEPTSPTPAGGFLITGQTRKLLSPVFLLKMI